MYWKNPLIIFLQNLGLNFLPRSLNEQYCYIVRKNFLINTFDENFSCNPLLHVYNATYDPYDLHKYKAYS
jgi:hypothetical protein